MRAWTFLALVLALSGPVPPGQAQRLAGNETLERVLPSIRAEHPGQLSDATVFVGSDGRTLYRVKWMTLQGQILYFNADPGTGRHTHNSGGEERAGRQQESPQKQVIVPSSMMS